MLQILGNPPFFTFSVFVLCIILYLIYPSISAGCLLPAALVSKLQLMRIFTSPFLHLNFFHILFNMIAWMSLAREFEQIIGSLPAIYVIMLLLIPINAIIHTAAATMIDSVFHTALSNECTVGISGVLFSLLVINLNFSEVSQVSVFGFFSLPVHVYPFVLVALFSLLAPSISFFGHLSGIASGYMFTNDWLRLFVPSNDRFQKIEDACHLTRLPAWQAVPSFFSHLLAAVSDQMRTPLLSNSNSSNSPSLLQRIQNAWGSFIARFSGTSSSDPSPVVSNHVPRQTTSSTETAFSGQGHALGGGNESRLSGGRVPPSSRLLQIETTHSATSGEPDTADGTSNSVHIEVEKNSARKDNEDQ